MAEPDFPPLAKYRDPTETLILNAAESEPGYYADKLMVQKEPELYVVAMDTLHRVFEFDELYLAYKNKDEPYFTEFLEDAADAPHIEPVAIEDEYNDGRGERAHRTRDRPPGPFQREREGRRCHDEQRGDRVEHS